MALGHLPCGKPSACVCVEPEGCVWKADVVSMREENKTPLIPENDTVKGPSSRKGL